MSAIDDLTAAVQRVQKDVQDVLAALVAATPDLGPATANLNATADSIEAALAPPAPPAA